MIPLIFLSTLLRRSVYDIEGRRLGTLHDISVSLNETFPAVTALIVRSLLGNNEIIIPWSQVHNLEEEQIHLTVSQPRIASYSPQPETLAIRARSIRPPATM